ncbi:TPA: hypothetical protein DCW38_03075 [candidate division WOR-3 bacterium]|uniref:Uncharacterized protein n=1 Tax=candidate division WOR-3 bacterium TaxID=2052148 RepID=A0A350H9C9_UNCW3|nr:hypothetical protein [candidate division WOR-3 bacterium]
MVKGERKLRVDYVFGVVLNASMFMVIVKDLSDREYEFKNQENYRRGRPVLGRQNQIKCLTIVN